MTELKPFSWVQERIIELAELYPERKANCQYFADDGYPDCIVGHVLRELGAHPSSREGTRIFNADRSRWVESGTFADHIDWTKFGVQNPCPAEAHWIGHVQHLQDTGSCWADAVAG